MRYIALISLAALVVAAGRGVARPAQQADDPEAIHVVRPMTVQDVIKLTQAGIADDIIVSQIEASYSRFNLSPEDIVNLKKANVNEGIIAIMILRSSARRQLGPSVSPPEDWMNDEVYSSAGVSYPYGYNYVYPAYYYGALGYAPYAMRYNSDFRYNGHRNGLSGYRDGFRHGSRFSFGNGFGFGPIHGTFGFGPIHGNGGFGWHR